MTGTSAHDTTPLVCLFSSSFIDDLFDSQFGNCWSFWMRIQVNLITFSSLSQSLPEGALEGLRFYHKRPAVFTHWYDTRNCYQLWNNLKHNIIQALCKYDQHTTATYNIQHTCLQSYCLVSSSVDHCNHLFSGVNKTRREVVEKPLN